MSVLTVLIASTSDLTVLECPCSTEKKSKEVFESPYKN